MIAKKTNKKTLHKNAINQVTQCESETQEKETTNIAATLYSKARATTLTGYNFAAKFLEKKQSCSQVSNGNKNGLDHESFYESNIFSTSKDFYILTPTNVKQTQTIKNNHKQRHKSKVYKFSSFSILCTSSTT